jgi:hypothetical protein
VNDIKYLQAQLHKGKTHHGGIKNHHHGHHGLYDLIGIRHGLSIKKRESGLKHKKHHKSRHDDKREKHHKQCQNAN